MEYPSIKNLYASNKVNGPGHERGPQYGFDAPGADQISKWLVLEKLDGMNMRVIWEPGFIDGGEPTLTPRFAGRTDRANIPGDLVDFMRPLFTYERMMAAFSWYEETEQGATFNRPDSVVLFGEGIGAGIQKAGQGYGPTKRFVLFDVLVDGQHWLKWDDVVDVAGKLGVEHATELARDVTLEEAKALVFEPGIQADPDHVEGIIGRTDPYLFDGRGNRVIFKYKVRDLPKVLA